jgi:23S rRNA (uridine2552-2'-O)-methyltransferase
MDYKRPDAWTRKAKAEGYAARSVYKLDELDRRHHVLPRRGAAVVDLGCFPGSWSRWLLERGARVVGVDLQAPELSGGTWIARSVYDVDADTLLEALGGRADLLVSDMAPNTTGNRLGDHVRQIELADRALELACACLTPEGGFVVKVFDGEDAPAYVNRVRAAFREVKRLKPDATRDRSVEFFLVAKGRKTTG